jgi:hypothetical protein
VLWSGGNILVVWDGRSHVDVNLFTHQVDNIAFAEYFESHFSESHFSEQTALTRTLRDEQPRGIGRVVSFAKDITPLPHWASEPSLS